MQAVLDLIIELQRTSEYNRLERLGNGPVYDEPLVGVADGHDPLFTQYKTIIGAYHMTPEEIMAHKDHKVFRDHKAILDLLGHKVSLAVLVLKDLKVEIRSDWETDSLFSQGGSYIRVSLFTGRKLDYIKARLSQARVASALRERPMDGGEFSLLKGRLLSRLLHDLESQETKIPQIAELYSLFGTVPQESALIRAIKSLNVYDLLRVAKKTLGENRSVVLESR